MKISKLFHWLYAILMFLPILVFIPNAFYYGFNEQAVAQEKTEQVPVYYESNDVNTLDDIQIDRIYKWNDNYTSQSTFTNQPVLFYLKYCDAIPVGSTNAYFYFSRGGNVLVAYSYDGVNYYPNFNLIECNFIISSFGDTSVINSVFVSKISSSNALVIKEYQPLVTNMSITDSMSYAWKSTWQNDLFSWSYDSFLTQPFLYITNLFNVPATNTLLYCLSYWLNISIIWLCFDVVMYVPLLVHRWLDKGIIE